MIPVSTALVFLGASAALALAPGPDNIFVLTQSALRGRWAGLIVTLGLCTGLVVHSVAVALGVAALLRESETAFTVLKTLGAVYLLYLAWGAFRAGAPETPARGDSLGWGRLYVRGVIMNTTNPKVAIFFLAFLPQFADPTRGSMPLQLLLLGALFALSTVVVFGTIAWTAGSLGHRLRSSQRTQRLMNRLAALVFVGLALRLAFSEL